LLVGDKTSSKEHEREVLVRDGSVKTEDELDGEEGKVRVEKRHTGSDRKRDEKALDRKLVRTLYLVVRGEGGEWGFPEGEVVGRENLNQVCFPYSPLPFRIHSWVCYWLWVWFG
jgi:large subunit ribosomal protein L46